MRKNLLMLLVVLCTFSLSFAQQKAPRFRIIALYENGGHHVDYSKAAKIWLDKLAVDSNFSIDYIQNTDKINDEFLSHYQLFLQLDYAPYAWKPDAVKAFEKYIEEGRGGWIGFHHATLLGEFDGYPMWQWFSDFMGGIRWKNYIATFVKGKVNVEDQQHPVMKGIPSSFWIKTEEFYTYDKSPRLNVHVIASVNENSYIPKSDVKMGDHPVIWSNEHVKARNVYIFMGHSPDLFDNDAYKKLFTNSIFWASGANHKICNTMKYLKFALVSLLLMVSLSAFAEPVIYISQIGFDTNGPKIAVIGSDVALPEKTGFSIVDPGSDKVAFNGTLGSAQKVEDWYKDRTFYHADFSSFKKDGKYKLVIIVSGKKYTSEPFQITQYGLAKLTLSSIIHYYIKQRANTPEELEADQHIKLYGSDKTVDLRGGWCDASGDVSKYFSHLSYANFMSPQQIPLVTWSMVSVDEKIPGLLTKWGLKDSLENEACYGADYIMHSLSTDGYFYETVFSYFSKNPNDRRVVGLHANSVTTNEYQAAFREGGGMAIAALARISRWKKHGEFTSQQYLDAAKRAFEHLLANNTKYDDDGKENILDDYCALMAATELWISTNNNSYRDEARKRAENLNKRMADRGYFIANDGNRPYWHASDAGLPVVALSRYLTKETDPALRAKSLQTIKKALDYNLRVSREVANPFGYARQSFLYKGKVKDGFFIPHDNETGWWWQGEDARLGSLATAAIVGGRLAYPAQGAWGVKASLANFASQQLSWITGCNPYSMCFMYGFGKNNVPYMHSSFGHGSQKGGISNGITGKDGSGDGSGIDFKTEAQGNEWRWTEQWLPHAAWFMQAIAVMAEPVAKGK